MAIQVSLTDSIHSYVYDLIFSQIAIYIYISIFIDLYDNLIWVAVQTSLLISPLFGEDCLTNILQMG